jgi:FkbM family methyltransferase
MTRAKFVLLKRLVSTVVCHPIVGRFIGYFYADKIPFRGVIVDVSLVNIPPENKCLLRWGLYESAEVRFVEKYLCNQLDTVDLGASLGAVSSKIASILKPNVSLVCVEGNPQLTACVKRNMCINASHLQVSVVPAAIAYGTDSVQFVVHDNNLCSSASKNSTMRSIDVPAIELNQLLVQNMIGTFQLVCDIEGAELGIIQNDSDSLLKCVQIIIELHGVTQGGQAISEENILAMFFEAGFFLVDRYGSVVVLRRANCNHLPFA